MLVGAVYNWIVERNVEDYRPSGHQIILSAGALALQLYAAYLGGELVYRYGVGVQCMGKGAEETTKREEKKQ